jgi:hypothetical protein
MSTSINNLYTPTAKEQQATTMDVRHFPRVIKGFVTTSDQPSIFIHGHDIFIVPINDIFHGKLITELITIGIPIGGVDRKGDPDEGQAVSGTRGITRIVTFGIPTFTIVSVKST